MTEQGQQDLKPRMTHQGAALDRRRRLIRPRLRCLLHEGVVSRLLLFRLGLWAPYKKGDIETLEKVQKRATKILPSLRHISYPDRLKVCK